MNDALGRGLLVGLLLLAPARAEDALTRHCRETAALMSVAVSIDAHAGGTRGDLLVELASSDFLGEVSGQATAASVTALLSQAERVEQRLAALETMASDADERARVAAARLGLARHAFGIVRCDLHDPADDELQALEAAWTARFVALACDAQEVTSSADASTMAEYLVTSYENVQRLGDRGPVEELLATAAGKLYTQDVVQGEAGIRQRIAQLEVPVEHVSGELRDLAQQLRALREGRDGRDGRRLSEALARAAGMRGMVERASELDDDWSALFEGFVTVGLQPTPRERFGGDFVKLEDRWTRVGAEDAGWAEPSAAQLAGARVAVLSADDQLVPLPRATRLGLDAPRLVPGFTYLLELDAGARPFRMLVELAADADAALLVSVPERVPGDTLLALRADEPTELLYVRDEPWSFGAWLDYLEEALQMSSTFKEDTGRLFALFVAQAGGPDAVDASVDAERFDARTGLDAEALAGRAVLGREHVELLVDIESREYMSLQLLQLPDTDQAQWLARVVGPALGWTLGAQRVLDQSTKTDGLEPGDEAWRVTVDTLTFDAL